MSHKILVIDDNFDMCESIAAMLKLANYTVVTANTGKHGIELVQTQRPDLILCDVMMPELDGYGVLHLLSKDPATADIPFIFLTAKSDQKDFRMGMNMGADDYIAKPFDGLELFNTIELRLKKYDLIRKTFHNNTIDINDFFTKTKQLPGFGKISDARLSRLYKKKEFIFMEGAQPLFLFFISKGLVKTFKSSSEGKELMTGLHHEGQFIGFLPLLENKPNNESAVALRDSEIFLIPLQDFNTVIYTNKEIARKFIAMLSSNLYKTENLLIELAYHSVRQRVATTLLSLSGIGDRAGKGPEVITLSRKDIASMLGTSTESLNRTLADFKDEGLIEIRDKGLKILNASRLQEVRY